jgi:hypothetical protein
MNLLFSEEATNFKARSIALASALQPFGLRVNTHFENSDINLDDIAPIVIPENPPWLNPKPRLVCFNIQTLNWRRSERSK